MEDERTTDKHARDAGVLVCRALILHSPRNARWRPV
jgi:hypothetical protein